MGRGAGGRAAFAFWALACLPAAVGAQPLDPALFDYDAAAPLGVEVAEEIVFAGGRALDLTYVSPMEGRVPAYLYLPEASAAPAPALVLMHGMGGTRGQLGQLAMSYARAGVVVLSISAPEMRPELEGRRSMLVPIPLFDDLDRRGMEQVGQDLRRAVDLLTARSEVDPERIGYVGFSLGGAYGLLATAIEPRFRALALLSPTSGLLTWLDTLHPSHPIAQEYRNRSPDEREAWRRSMRPVEPVRWLRRAQRRPLLVQAATRDGSVAASDTETLFSAAPGPKALLWYEGGHNLPAAALLDQARFLAPILGFDAARFEPPRSVLGTVPG